MEYQIKTMKDLVPKVLRNIVKRNEESDCPLPDKDREILLEQIKEMEK